MLRSLFAGVTGLRSHQTRMDVIGNNIANVNTIGYKSSRVTFQDLMSQTLQGASAPQNGRGGTNPMQVGLGVQLATIDSRMEAGSPQTTGVATDLSLEGDGFFMLTDGGGRTFYTRAGNFQFEKDGRFTYSSNGYGVLGWAADGSGTIDQTGTPEALRISFDDTVSPIATTEVGFAGNLDARYAVADDSSVSIDVYDSLGALHTVEVTYEKTNTDRWSYQVHVDGGTTPVGGGTLVFDGNGKLDPTNSAIGPFTITPTNGADPVTITPDFSDITQFAEAESQETPDQNGYPSGTLDGVTIDPNGVITGIFSNGMQQALGQVALAEFNNAGGLSREGGTMFSESPNSGNAKVGAAGTGGIGGINPGSLEMSNVDLSKAFTNMIVTQRGFQANSRVITTSDEILQELVNLKR